MPSLSGITGADGAICATNCATKSKLKLAFGDFYVKFHSLTMRQKIDRKMQKRVVT